MNPTTTTQWNLARILKLALVAIAAIWLLTRLDLSPLDSATGAAGSGGDDGRGYMAEARCQPVDDTDDPSDGVIPSPEELLPDPALCPEFYEGDPDAVGVAPPPSAGPPVSTDPPDASGSPYNPCADGASLNGHPCIPIGDDPTYPSPDPPYPTYPDDPPLPQPDY